MSRASKITFALSCVFCVTTVIGVHYVQDMERNTLHQGPIKDAKRVAEKRAEREAEAEAEAASAAKNAPSSSLDAAAKEKKRNFNKSDHELQQALRKKYESIQPLTGEVTTKDGERVGTPSK
ncbi:Pet117 protein [Maudiozyma humilis]|uniref:Pet117 protein n=1 Tax=Maudiozyma humilis TaxID=51915 RepID=A0AAV5RY02_MAUHU|nr:Pet117 protein [Kazachstania humilis]